MEAASAGDSSSPGGVELSAHSQPLLMQCHQLEDDQASAVCDHFRERASRAASRLVAVCQAAQELPVPFGPEEVKAESRLEGVHQRLVELFTTEFHEAWRPRHLWRGAKLNGLGRTIYQIASDLNLFQEEEEEEDKGAGEGGGGGGGGANLATLFDAALDLGDLLKDLAEVSDVVSVFHEHMSTLHLDAAGMPDLHPPDVNTEIAYVEEMVNLINDDSSSPDAGQFRSICLTVQEFFLERLHDNSSKQLLTHSVAVGGVGVGGAVSSSSERPSEECGGGETIPSTSTGGGGGGEAQAGGGQSSQGSAAASAGQGSEPPGIPVTQAAGAVAGAGAGGSDDDVSRRRTSSIMTSSLVEPTISGWLWKSPERPGMGRKQQRWFELHLDVLMYFDKQNGGHRKGVVRGSVHDYNLVPMSALKFQMRPTDTSDASARVYILEGAAQKETEAWLKALRSAPQPPASVRNDISRVVDDQRAVSFWKSNFGGDTLGVPFERLMSALNKEGCPVMSKGQQYRLQVLFGLVTERNVTQFDIAHIFTLFRVFDPVMPRPRALINSGYFHTDMDEDEANQHLAGRNQGTFLVRSHVSLPSALSVSWVTEHCYVQHSLVHMASNRDVFLRNTEYATRFPRLEALIQGLQFLECGCCANHNPESGCPAHSYFPKSAQQGPSVEEEELNKQINDEVLLPRWEDDSERDYCHVITCLKEFTRTKGFGERRHHCRNCGRLCCSECSNGRIPLLKFGYKKAVRVCVMCLEEMEDQADSPAEPGRKVRGHTEI